jgi:flagellin
MRINHNIAALNTYRQLSANTVNTSKSLEKLSSGLRINRAGDDAAGLAISEKMRSQIRGLDTAARNANDGSPSQTAGALKKLTAKLADRASPCGNPEGNRTTQTAEGTNRAKKLWLNETHSGDPAENEAELPPGCTGCLTNDTGSVYDELTDLRARPLLEIQKENIGANSGQNTSLSINNMDAESLGVDGINLETQAAADAAITTIDNALSKVSSQRAALGAMQNRLEHTINNLGTASENLSAAESRIRDVDMAKEMMEFTKNNILSQASQAMLAQANMQPQSVLQLLQ